MCRSPTPNGLTLWMQEQSCSHITVTVIFRKTPNAKPKATNSKANKDKSFNQTKPLTSWCQNWATFFFFKRFVKECQLANDYDDLSLVGGGKKMSTPVSSWLKSGDAKIKSARQSTSWGSNIHPQPSESHVDLEKDDSLRCVVNVPYSAVA